jgi:hypothetical protein
MEDEIALHFEARWFVEQRSEKSSTAAASPTVPDLILADLAFQKALYHPTGKIKARIQKLGLGDMLM